MHTNQVIVRHQLSVSQLAICMIYHDGMAGKLTRSNVEACAKATLADYGATFFENYDERIAAHHPSIADLDKEVEILTAILSRTFPDLAGLDD